jgi:hypothetical protein
MHSCPAGPRRHTTRDSPAWAHHHAHTRAGVRCFASAGRARRLATRCSPGCSLMHPCPAGLGATRRGTHQHGLTTMRTTSRCPLLRKCWQGSAPRDAVLTSRCSPADAHQQMPLLRNRLEGSPPHDAVIISTGRTSRCSRAGAHCFAIARQARSYTTLCSPGCPLMHSCPASPRRHTTRTHQHALTSMRSPADARCFAIARQG